MIKIRTSFSMSCSSLTIWASIFDFMYLANNLVKFQVNFKELMQNGEVQNIFSTFGMAFLDPMYSKRTQILPLLAQMGLNLNKMGQKGIKKAQIGSKLNSYSSNGLELHQYSFKWTKTSPK